MPGEFLDTNVLVYDVTTDRRAAAARVLLGRGGVTSVQALNEFANVARRKLGMSWREMREALAAIRTLCRPMVPVDIDTHVDALRIAERHGYAIFDALMIAAALRADCAVLYSEDMQNGMAIDARLRIVNPFRDPAAPAGRALTNVGRDDRAFGEEGFDLGIVEAVGFEDLAGVLAVDGRPGSDLARRV